jgi:myo-inositol 2-dehydrogenase/D-chiro-inositol 1-dehydrogenase
MMHFFRQDTMTTPKKEPDKIERRDFLKKSAAAGVLAAGFPGIISGQTLTNSLKLGLVGCGGRGSGAAGQALTANKNNELTAVADIDEEIVKAATTRYQNSTKFGSQVKIERAYVGLDASRRSSTASTSCCWPRRRDSGRST